MSLTRNEMSDRISELRAELKAIEDELNNSPARRKERAQAELRQLELGLASLPSAAPPQSEHEQLSFQRQQLEEKLRRATGDFNRSKATYGDPGALKELKAVAQKCRKAIGQIDEQLEATPERQRERKIKEDAEELQAARTRVGAQQRAEVGSINI